jgi:tRNA-dihydrouridine synthase
MLSTRRLPSEKLETTNELKTVESERFFVPQLLGNEERFIEPSIRKLMQLSPWGFDINMGCPVNHILRHNWGVRLMGDPTYAAEVVRVAKKHAKVPVSVKLRGSADETIDREYLETFTKALEEAGVDWLTIHARPRSQKHTGAANWNLVAEVAAARSVPVVANGDIQTAEDACRLLLDYKVDGAMIARAATIRPWILWQIAEKLGITEKPIGMEERSAPQTGEGESQEYLLACLRLIDFLEQYFGDSDYSLQKFRFFVATGSKWMFFGHAFWKQTMKCRNLNDLRDVMRLKLEQPSFPIAARVEFN